MDCEPASYPPIGRIHCDQRYRYEAARQAVLSLDNTGIVRLEPGQGYEAALAGLEGFERLWLIYDLHLNETWRPMVSTPRADAPRFGVFATRSPHRPNRLGLSCVELVRIDGLDLHVRNHDLLDLTPILDIKPYVPYADAFPDARAGWTDETPIQHYELHIAPAVAERFAWLREHGGLDADRFARIQLGSDPDDTERKRNAPDPHDPDGRVIAYRTWRLHYHIDEPARRVTVTALRSGYTPADLAPDTPDRHADKPVHRAYRERWGDS
jgi:tRNA-Thr(GGU) m(6)t(6)A37 methyltransferase TsaA